MEGGLTTMRHTEICAIEKNKTIGAAAGGEILFQGKRGITS
jgi:hypothetical protein